MTSDERTQTCVRMIHSFLIVYVKRKKIKGLKGRKKGGKRKENLSKNCTLQPEIRSVHPGCCYAPTANYSLHACMCNTWLSGTTRFRHSNQLTPLPFVPTDIPLYIYTMVNKKWEKNKTGISRHYGHYNPDIYLRSINTTG